MNKLKPKKERNLRWRNKKKKLSKNGARGITLIALVITIIVLLILAAVSIATLTGDNGILKKAIEAKKKVEDAQVEENKDLGEIEELIENNTITKEGFNERKGVNIPKIGKEDNTKGLIPIKYDENKNKWIICSEDDTDWYDYKSNNMKWANAMLSDGKYTINEKKDGQEKAKIGQEVDDIDLGSMFVWIPRYAYSITEYKVEKEGKDGETQNIINVEFLQGNSNMGINGTIYPTDYSEDTVKRGEKTPMIVHPAFEFGGAKLQGIWIAKFEASMAEEDKNTTADNNTDVLQKTVKILPNKESWRYITEGNAFKVCLNMAEKEDYQLPSKSNIHQIRNSEWGCVAYLAASQYGKVPAINSFLITEAGIYHSYTAGDELEGTYRNNTIQSTTGNVYGVYDMNGGTEEFVSAWFDNEGDNLSTNGGDLFKNNKLDSKYEIYFEKYEVSPEEKMNGVIAYNMQNEEGNKQLAQMAYDKLKLMKGIKGDGIYEVSGNTASYWGRTSPSYSSDDWFEAKYDDNGFVTDAMDSKQKFATVIYGKDYINFLTTDAPFMTRGGPWWTGDSSGIFATTVWNGGTHQSHGFRPVVVL